MDIHSLFLLRENIDRIDLTLLSLLAERRRLVQDIANIKQKISLPIRDKRREQHLLTTLIQAGKAQQLDENYIRHLFHLIIKDSVLTQKKQFVTPSTITRKKNG